MADIIEQPLVTVGICCYNRTEGFINTLKYITGQTYKNLEIIISQDSHPSLDFAPIAAAATDSRIVFYKQPAKLGMYNNFSFLLQQAGGEYFMWASDDDWWAADFIEKIMDRLTTDPDAVAGFSDFMEVDEANERIAAYPVHLPLLQEFAITDDVKRISNYINQFEGLGKANLFYAICKTRALRTTLVLDFLKEGNLPCDMLINLTVLVKGKLALVPEILRTCTVGNVKEYDQISIKPKLKNYLLFYFNQGAFNLLHKKWSRYIFDHFKIIARSDLSIPQKLALYPVLYKKLLLFYYDLFCVNVTLRGYNIFSKITRQHTLN